jgi:hypothetical protein
MSIILWLFAILYRYVESIFNNRHITQKPTRCESV